MSSFERERGLAILVLLLVVGLAALAGAWAVLSGYAWS
jgi:hypothetical protein